MGELTDPSVLDLDEIEDYLHSRNIRVLGENSRLGVDFGSYWTSSADEHAARNAARVDAGRIRTRFREFQGGRLLQIFLSGYLVQTIDID